MKKPVVIVKPTDSREQVAAMVKAINAARAEAQRDKKPEVKDQERSKP